MEKENNFTDLNGQVIRVVYAMESPFVNSIDLDLEEREGHYKGAGVVMDILKLVRDKYNVKFNFTQSLDGDAGSQLPNGDWSGMIGMLHRNEADIIANNIIVTDARKDVVDFSTPFMTTASGMMIRSPKQFIDNRFVIVTAPLEWRVWMVIAIAIVLSGFLFQIICYFLRKRNRELYFPTFECYWTFFAIFVQQDLARLPECMATRTMLSFWWLAALSISGFFTGNMVALFAVSRNTLPFNTRDDMVEKVRNGRYKVILTNTSTTRVDFIRNSGQRVFQDLWGAMKAGKWINVSTLEEGVQRVIKQPNMVFISAKESLEALASRRDNCDVTTLDGDLIPVRYAIATRKNSTYTELFNDIIDKLGEMGLVNKWLNDAKMMQAYERGTCCNSSLGAGIGSGGNIDITGEPIDIERAQGIFWLLVIGGAMAVASFMLERLWRMIRPRSQSIPTEGQNGMNNTNQIQVINVKSIESNPNHVVQYDLEESVNSYRPSRRNTENGEEQGKAQLEYNNFQSNVYRNSYGNGTSATDHGRSIEIQNGNDEKPKKPFVAFQ